MLIFLKIAPYCDLLSTRLKLQISLSQTQSVTSHAKAFSLYYVECADITCQEIKLHRLWCVAKESMTTIEAAVRLREEEEELQCCTKKVKENHCTKNISESTSPWTEGRWGSYKERLTREIPRAYEWAFSFKYDMETKVNSNDESFDLVVGIAGVNFSGARNQSTMD